MLCLLPSPSLFSSFTAAGEQASPCVLWLEGNEPVEVTGSREGGNPLSTLPETRPGVAGERQSYIGFACSLLNLTQW